MTDTVGPVEANVAVALRHCHEAIHDTVLAECEPCDVLYRKIDAQLAQAAALETVVRVMRRAILTVSSDAGMSPEDWAALYGDADRAESEALGSEALRRVKE